MATQAAHTAIPVTSSREAVAAGTNFSNQETGAAEPARQDCYTCHNIHTTYTKDDFGLADRRPL